MLLPNEDNEMFHSTDHVEDEVPANNSEPVLIAQNGFHGPSFEGGLLIVWGCGEFGQHGHGHLNDVHCADAVGVPLWLGQDRQMTSVACGSSHTLAITDDNKLYSWGNSNSGQLGIGSSHTNPQPQCVLLGVSSGTKLQGITCGTRHSFVWTQDGDAFSFGNNYSAQLGYDFRRPDFKENQPRPIFVDTLLHRPVHQVACGARHSVFLFKDGRVASVGANNRGQLGTGDCVDSESPLNVSDVSDICWLACGNSHSLAADGQGNVYSWGYGKACGSKTDILSPLCTLTGSNASVKSLAGGDSHSVLLLSDGRVLTWGNNFEGQLGQGKAVKFIEVPTEVKLDTPLDEKVVCISGGENTSAAVTESGQLFLWGKNASNIIRRDKGPRTFQYEPYPINLGNWKVHKVSCGSWHVACIVTGSGRLQCKPRTCTNRAIFAESEQLPSENGLIQQQYHDERKCETEGHTMITEKERQVFFAEQESNDDKRTKMQSFSTAAGSSAQSEESAAVNGLESDDDGVVSLPSWLDPVKVRTAEPKSADRSDHEDPGERARDLFDGEVLNRAEKIPSQPPCCIETTTVGSSGEEMIPSNSRRSTLNMEDPFSSKRPIPCVESTIDGEADEFAVCFETSVLPSAIEGHMHEASKRESSMTSLSTDSVSGAEINQEVSADASEVDLDGATPRSCDAVASTESLMRTARTRVMSDSSTRMSRDGPPPAEIQQNQLKSNSLTNVTLGFVYDSNIRTDPMQQQSTSSSPPSLRYVSTTGRTGITGQLNREKKAPRTLRRVSWGAEGVGEYYLPNQPMHTTELTGAEWQKRHIPQTPVHRTQSSPSLYSSNLVRSPPASAQVSLKDPRPRVSSNSRLPPRPPAGRKPAIRRPLFSSGTSWRSRK